LNERTGNVYENKGLLSSACGLERQRGLPSGALFQEIQRGLLNRDSTWAASLPHSKTRGTKRECLWKQRTDRWYHTGALLCLWKHCTY